MGGRGVRISRSELTRPYDRYKKNSEGKYEKEVHRYGIVPSAEFDIASGYEDKGVQVTVKGTSGGYVGTTENDPDPSRIKRNGKVYGEIYGGDGKGLSSSATARYAGRDYPYPLSSSTASISPVPGTVDLNVTKYADTNNFLDDNGKVIASSAYDVWSGRILENAPMKCIIAGDKVLGLDLADSAKSQYIGYAGMTTSILQLTGRPRFTVMAEPNGSHMTFYKGHDAIFKCVNKVCGTITHIGPIHWSINRDWVETSIYIELRNGQDGTLCRSWEITGCSGMTGKTSGDWEWSGGSINFTEGFTLKFSHGISASARVDVSKVNDDGFVCHGLYPSTELDLKGYVFCNYDSSEKRHSVTFTSNWSNCSIESDDGNLVRVRVPHSSYLDTPQGEVTAPRQPKYNGDPNIYEYIIRFRGIDPNALDWNGNAYGDDTPGPDGNPRPTGAFQINGTNQMFAFVNDNFDAFSAKGFVRDADTGDVYRIHRGSDILKLNGDANDMVYTKNFKLYHFKCTAYHYENNYNPIPTPGYIDIWTNANGTVSIEGADPGTMPGGTHIGWRVYARDDDISTATPKGEYSKTEIKNIIIMGDDAKIVPVFSDTPIQIGVYQITKFSQETGMEEYSDTPTEILDARSEKPVELPAIQSLGQGYECYFPIGWYSGPNGTGQYITEDEQGRHIFHGSASIYSHFVLNTIDGIEWGLCEKKGEIWDWQPPYEFTGKSNVFFVGREDGIAETITVGARVYPNDITAYGQITRITVSNGMFDVTEADNALSGKELYRNITPANDTKASTLDYMVLTAYTNVGIKSQACVFYVDKVIITLNTDVSVGNGDTISSTPEEPITDHSDNGLTAYFKSHISPSRQPSDGDTIKEHGTPYSTVWIYHASRIAISETESRNWVEMGSYNTTVKTELGRLEDIPIPSKYSFSQGRRIQCVFMGWCDSKGTMISDAEGKIIGDDKLFLKSTELFASWVRPEDFAECDMMVLQRPISKGDYSRLMQLKLIAPTSMSLKYAPSVKSTAIPMQTAENAFTFDQNVKQSVSLEFTRVSPSDYDNTSDDTDRWANGRWMEELVRMQNRYQTDTDGEKFLYIPLDCGLRRYKYAKSDSYYGSYYRYAYYGYRYMFVGKCTDRPKGTVSSVFDLSEISASPGDIYFVESIEQMFIYDERDDDVVHWHMLMGHETDPNKWDKGFRYTNAYGETHWYMGRNVYMTRVTPEYSAGRPEEIKFDVALEVGGLEENMSDVIEW